MKKLFTLLSIVLAFNTFAQTPAKSSTKAKLSEKDIMMCDKEWHVVALEEWGVASKPGEKNKNDMVKFSQDGTYTMIMFGVTKSGTWSKSGQSIAFKDAATKGQFYLKVLVQEPGKLKVDHYSDEEGHSIFEYEVK